MKKIKLDTFLNFNPSESLVGLKEVKKIPLNALNTNLRKIDYFEISKPVGGAKFRNGDTLVAKITPSLENGKTGLVKILDEGEVGLGSTEFIVLRANEHSDSNFIYYLARSPMFRERAISLMEGTSGRKRVNENSLRNTDFVLPALSVQRKIAHVLSVIDEKIELNLKMNVELEQMAQRIYEYWFLQFDFPNEKGKPYKSSGGKMVLNKILKSEIPVGWQVRKLGEVSEIRNGGTPSTTDKSNYGGNISWATPKDLSVSGEKFFFKGQRNISEKGAKSLGGIPIPKDSILLTSRAPIGLIAINKTETYTNQGFKNIVPNSEMISVEYLFYCLSKGIKNLINLGGGTTLLYLNLLNFVNLMFMLNLFLKKYNKILKKINLFWI